MGWLQGEPARIADIAAAIDEARTVPDGHIREGVTDRKVLGTLPVTADGCVVGTDAVLHHPDAEGPSFEINYEPFFDVIDLSQEGDQIGGTRPVGECYSTEAAAEEARKA